ncbi:MAG: GNAT family N-acetyltransferase [Asgard group archaeon]|nr:GNAT family N-acetyltransferase [Asgard group archaeon]
MRFNQNPMQAKNIIRLLQEISSNAWPALKHHILNGWIIRLAEGVTRRANSVLPLSYYGENIQEDIDFVEEIYNQWNLPSVFQIPDYHEPKNLSHILEDRGYLKEAESLVMKCAIKEISTISQNLNFSYSNSNKESEEWFTALKEFNNSSNERISIVRKIINRISQPKKFFYAKENESIVGVTLVVIERSHLGIYNMATKPEYRRQGIAKSIFAEIKKWATEQNIGNIYLQVQGDNLGAINLYKSVNLRETFRYRYMIKN